ncbi:MAG: class II glutamine amidotransferase [Deltaproteobacteria bacterium]|nr:class II glutamine amidotransferase [Deltaproteobacteria bacterium]MBT4640916.1 class II glutamine amidotransferase [Deltaproteobacteria bacterium]MBT6498754.1 class II glutamine amidotransferase [Deltaproteobacteria bacterium]MBT7156187.1 class II glutamine amidotransferase [Deltaproteobacteria bacterium]MBT7716705.1 class II glutamine amidotransferase [Deltaproteobacteria bacterium]
MCELMGMSAKLPTDICFSFSGLMQRGGKTGPHKDGWGITFYDGKGCRTFKDSTACADCTIAELVQSYSIKSQVVISHIRKANRGKVGLENTHPFMRELWGRYWTFAHNGQIKGIKKRLKELKKSQSLNFQPVGTTDSEAAFCYILNRIHREFEGYPNTKKRLWAFIAELSRDLSSQGVFNILLSEGKHLFSHCNKELYWITRKAPFGSATLKDADITIDFQQKTMKEDVVTIIASNPLTRDEKWGKLKQQTGILFCKGEIMQRYA